MAKKCPKGKVCGDTCIRKTYKCKYDAPAVVVAGLETLAKEAGKKTKVPKKKKDDNSTATIDVRLAPPDELKRVRDSAIAAYAERGITEEDLKNVMSSVSTILSSNETKIAMATSNQFFEDFLDKGAYNDFSGKGANYVRGRKETEQKAFGIGTTEELSKRPYYAYLATGETVAREGDREDDIDGYGDIRLVFKNSVKNAATTTLDDSGYGTSATALLKPDIEFLAYRDEPYFRLSKEDVEEMKKAKTVEDLNFSYIEAQIHKQPTSDDLEEVVLNPSISNEREQEIRDSLAKRGLNVKITRKKEGNRLTTRFG